MTKEQDYATQVRASQQGKQTKREANLIAEGVHLLLKQNTRY
jgi:hypothetical protein